MSDTRTLTPDDGYPKCSHCGYPYSWEENLLTGEFLWVRRCVRACKTSHPKAEAEWVPKKVVGS